MGKVFIEGFVQTIDFKVLGMHTIIGEDDTETTVPILEVGLAEELKFLLCVYSDTAYYRFLSGYEDRQYEDVCSNRIFDEETLIRYFIPNEDGILCDVLCDFSSARALEIYRNVNVNSKLGTILNTIYNKCLTKMEWIGKEITKGTDKNKYAMEITDKYTEETFTIGLVGFYKTDLEKLPAYVINTGKDLYLVAIEVYLWSTLCSKIDRNIDELLLFKNLREVMTTDDLDEKIGCFSISVLSNIGKYEKQLFQSSERPDADSKFIKTARRIIAEFNNRIKENEIEQIFNDASGY